MTSPLPTDHQVVRAIKDRKQEFMDNYKSRLNGKMSVHDSMYFHHICKVLDHAEKLFNCPVEDWLLAENWDEEKGNS